MLVRQRSCHKYHKSSGPLAVSGVAWMEYSPTIQPQLVFCPQGHDLWDSGAGILKTLSVSYQAALSEGLCGSSPPHADSGGFLSPFALSAPLPSSWLFPLCNCCPEQLHPLPLQQWTEERINHISEEDTPLFISLTPAAMGRPGCPQPIDW